VNNITTPSPEPPESVGRAYFNLRQASDYTGQSEVTLRRAMRDRRLAYLRPNEGRGPNGSTGRVYFLLRDLVRYMERNRIAAVGES
jgi:Helix-turn-helix domain